MRLLTLLLLAACSSGKGGAHDTDVGTNDDADSRVDDTDDDSQLWETGVAGDMSSDYVRDPKLGPTPDDGTWTGTFHYIEYPTIGATNPTCDGTLTFTIDGDAPMHVFGTCACDTWDPNFDIHGLPPALDGPYGPMTGVFTAELDPTNYAKFRTTVDFSAANMKPFSKDAIAVTIDGDTLTIDFHDVKNLPVVGKVGNELTATATRTPTP